MAGGDHPAMRRFRRIKSSSSCQSTILTHGRHGFFVHSSQISCMHLRHTPTSRWKSRSELNSEICWQWAQTEAASSRGRPAHPNSSKYCEIAPALISLAIGLACSESAFDYREISDRGRRKPAGGTEAAKFE